MSLAVFSWKPGRNFVKQWHISLEGIDGEPLCKAATSGPRCFFPRGSTEELLKNLCQSCMKAYAASAHQAATTEEGV